MLTYKIDVLETLKENGYNKKDIAISSMLQYRSIIPYNKGIAQERIFLQKTTGGSTKWENQ